MKLYTLLSLILISTLAFGMGSRRPAPVEKPKVEEVKPVIVDPGFIDIKLKVEGTAPQVVRITRLAEVAEKIINSEKFKKRVLGAWYNGKAQFVDTDLSNVQVYEAIRKGNELESGNDYVWNLEVGIAKNKCSVLGWTYPSIKKFYFNSCGFDQRDDAGVTGTICHEYQHKLGFDHSFKWTKSREYSEPYAIGTICAELYEEFK